MKIEFKKRIFYYSIIFIFLFLQYGFSNINELGFNADDWDYVKHVTEGINPSLLNLIKFQSSHLSLPGFALSRPLGLLTNALHVWISGTNVSSHHFWKLFLLVIANVLLFEFFKNLLKSNKLALVAVLIYISLPYHTSTYYWVSTRVSVYAMIFALVSILCVQKNNRLSLYFLGPLSLLLSVSGYELFIGIIPIIAYIIFFTPQFENRTLSDRLFVLLLYTLSALGIFLYRRYVIVGVLNYSLPKEVNLSESFSIFSRYQYMVSNIFGVGLYRFIISSCKSLTQIKTLSYLKFLMFFLTAFSFFISCFIFSIPKNVKDRGFYKNILHIGIITITTGMVSLLFANYNYTLGTAGLLDRVNIFIDIGISLLIIYLFLNIPKNIAKLFLFLILVFYTMINWVFLSEYIKSYYYQKAFMSYVKTIGIPNNSLIFLDTDLETSGGVYALSPTWGVTSVIAYATNQDRVEHVGDWSSYKGKGKYEVFYSKQYRNYIYYNPNIIHLEFNKSDFEKY